MGDIFEQFFFHLYRGIPHPDKHYVGWGDFRHDSENAMRFFTVEQLLSGVVAVYPDKKNMFFTPAPRKNQGNKKEDVAGSAVAWVDHDGYKGSGEEPPLCLVPPSFIVASGGPGGYHLYWLLNQWASPEEIEALNKVMSQHIGIPGTDHQCANYNRVLRIPGTINHKDRGDTRCELVVANPQYRYDYNDLIKLGTVTPDIFDVPEGKTTSERDWGLALAIKMWGCSDELAKIVLRHHSEKAQKEGDHYVDLTISNAGKSAAVRATETTKVKEPKTVLEAPPMNFMLVPVGQLITPDNDRVGLVVRVEWGDRSRVKAIKQEHCSSKAQFLKWLRNVDGGLAWWGSDNKLIQMYSELVAQAPPNTQFAVEQAGRYDLIDGTRVFIYGNDEVLSWPKQEAMVNVAWEPKIGISTGLTFSENGHRTEEEVLWTYQRMFETMLTVQPPEVLYPALGWTVATLFKPVIESFEGRLPILMLYGVRGSGKTSIAREVLLRLVGLFGSPISADITPFALYGNLSATRSWPVWIGEFRNSNRNAETLMQTLRAAYDIGQVERGTVDMSIIQYHLTAPVIVDGETPFIDSATSDRTISIKMDHNVVVTPAYVAAFDHLRTWELDDWAQVAGTLVAWTLTKDKEYVQNLYISGTQKFQSLGFTSRVTNNITCCWVGWAILADFLSEFDIALNLSIEPFIAALGNTHKPGIGNATQADLYISEVSHMAAANPLGMGVVYEGDVMWVSLTRAKMLVKTQLPIEMIETQLEARQDSYVVGKRIGRGGRMWGIDLVKAQTMGLDVALGDCAQAFIANKDGYIQL